VSVYVIKGPNGYWVHGQRRSLSQRNARRLSRFMARLLLEPGERIVKLVPRKLPIRCDLYHPAASGCPFGEMTGPHTWFVETFAPPRSCR
jgi:hypothetical protein